MEGGDWAAPRSQRKGERALRVSTLYNNADISRHNYKKLSTATKNLFSPMVDTPQSQITLFYQLLAYFNWIGIKWIEWNWIKKWFENNYFIYRKKNLKKIQQFDCRHLRGPCTLSLPTTWHARVLPLLGHRSTPLWTL